MSSSLSSPAPLEDQAKLLDEILNVVKVQSHLMKKCLVSFVMQITFLAMYLFLNRKIINLWTV